MTDSKFMTQIRSRLGLSILGGEWALSLPKENRQNLTKYWFDGLFKIIDAKLIDIERLQYGGIQIERRSTSSLSDSKINWRFFGS